MERVTLLAATLVALLSFGEGAARLLHARRAAAGLEGVPDAAELPVIESLHELAGKNVRAIHKGVYYRSNSRGLRGPEYESRPAPGTFRILITGDSVTMGSGVREEHTTAAGDSRRIDQRRPPLAPR